MTEYDNKISPQDTAESFCPLRPLENGHTNPQPQIYSYIQELTSILTQKKGQLKDLKWQTHSLKGKYEQQDRRISEIKVSIDYEIEKEEIEINNSKKYKELQCFMEDDIRKLQGDVESLKDELTVLYEELTN